MNIQGLNKLRLTTKRLNIRLVEESDLAAVYDIHKEPEVNLHLPYDSWHSMEDAHNWYAYVEERRAKQIAQHYVIARNDSNEVIGACLSFNFKPDLAEAEFGYVLNKKAWGKGYMYEAMEAFVNELQKTLSLKVLCAAATHGNIASAKLLEKLGLSYQSDFVDDGVTLSRFSKLFC